LIRGVSVNSNDLFSIRAPLQGFKFYRVGKNLCNVTHLTCLLASPTNSMLVGSYALANCIFWILSLDPYDWIYE
jgi:hypothetical protein